MRFGTFAVASLFATAVPGAALAHPGHGTIEAQHSLHYLLDHPLMAVALVAVAIGGGAWIAKRFIRRLTSSVD